MNPAAKLLSVKTFAHSLIRGSYFLSSLAFFASTAHSQTQEVPFSSSVENCIVPASQYHGVNPHILRAILRVESSLKPNTVSRNRNGTADIGIGQINSIHLRELAKFGIAAEQLLDHCVGTYVAAWHLKKGIASGGNTWEAIAKYHSNSPYFNRRYQVLLRNELLRSKVISGQPMPVPALVQSAENLAAFKNHQAAKSRNYDDSAQLVVFDR